MRINSKGRTYLLLAAITLLSAACSSFGGSEYDKLVKKELARGVRSDSLFMGIYLGMSSKAFYAHCWDMNKKGLFTNGTENVSVLYKVDSALKYPALMNFYPDFYDDKIFNMWATFEYTAWAPWNKALSADSLMPDVLRMYRKWYPGGNDFITITNPEKGTIYVKVDGNRRITIGRYNDSRVKVDYTDLPVENFIKEKNPKK